MGSEKPRASATGRVAPSLSYPRPPVSPPRPLPSFLRRQEPRRSPSSVRASTSRWPAQATSELPNSSLPPSRGEVRWVVGRHECAPPLGRTTIAYATPIRHSCAGRNPDDLHRQCALQHPDGPPKPLPNSPIHPSPLSGGRLGGGWGATSVRHRSCRLLFVTPAPPLSSPPRPLPSFLRRQESTQRVPSPPTSNARRRRKSGLGGPSGCWAGTDGGERLGSCLRRNDGESAGTTERRRPRADG